MYLKQLNISGLRNLQPTVVEFSPEFTLFWGDNGAGKTAILEAFHLLSTATSFRGHYPQSYITLGQNNCCLTGILQDLNRPEFSLKMGLSRSLSLGLRLRLGSEDCPTIGEFAKTLPLQLINSESYALLEGPPLQRRQFIDWGTFHVEHAFYPAWQRYSRALKQRNAALKHLKAGGKY